MNKYTFTCKGLKFEWRFFKQGLKNIKRHWWKLGSFDNHMHKNFGFQQDVRNRLKELEKQKAKINKGERNDRCNSSSKHKK